MKLMIKSIFFIFLLSVGMNFPIMAEVILKRITILGSLYEFNHELNRYVAVPDYTKNALPSSSTQVAEEPSTALGKFFNPITQKLQSISDTFENNFFARFAGGMVLTVLVAYIIKKVEQGSFLSINKKAEPTAAKDHITFKDYIGEIPVAALDLVEQLKNPEKYQKMGIPVTKGILLYGPPGSGKTYLARAIAGEVGCPFIPIAGSYFSESIVGQGKRTVQNLFANAENAARQSKTKTAIIFIDEIDAIGSRAKGANLRGETEVINTLLDQMDGFHQRNDINVVVMGATNLVENVDEALRRSGRLDYKIEVPYLDSAGREKLIAHFLSKFISDTAVNAHWLAEMTDGFSPADIKLMFEIAGRSALRRNKEMRDKDSFIEAIEQIKKSLSSQSVAIIPDDKSEEIELSMRLKRLLSLPPAQR